MVEGQSVSPKGKNSLCWRAQGGIGKPRLESVFSRVLPDMDASVHERMLVTSSHERLHWNSKRIMSDRSRKRIKGLYYNKGLPTQSLRTLVDMGSALGMLGIDFLVATGETWAKAIRETEIQSQIEASPLKTTDNKHPD